MATTRSLIENTNPKNTALASAQMQMGINGTTNFKDSKLAGSLGIQNQSSSKKASCESKGGRWDEATQTCIMPQAPVNKNPPAGTIETFSNAQGRASGVSLPTGETYLGLNPNDVNQIAAGEAQRVARPENSAPIGTAGAEAQRQQRNKQLMQMAQQGLLTPQQLDTIQQTDINWGQALTAGTLGNLPSVLTNVVAGAGAGATGGALIGGAAGLGIGAVPGAIGGGIIGGTAGLIKGIWGGTQANIKSQQKGEIAATKDVLNAARTNMKALTMIVSKDPTKAEEAIQLYYNQLSQVQKAQRKLQRETEGNLNSFMEDGTQDLSDFELFLQPGGYAEIQLMRLQQAVNKGQPASDAELLNLYQEEYSDGQ